MSKKEHDKMFERLKSIFENIINEKSDLILIGYKCAKSDQYVILIISMMIVHFIVRFYV